MMNIDQFITAVENVYGKYDNEFLYAVVVKYVKENFEEDEYDSLFGKILTRFSPDRKPLDVARISSVKMEAVAIKAERIWQELLPKSPMDDVVITDTYTYQVVTGYGSWAKFCRERDDNREWTHKDFLKRYVSLFREGEYVRPTVLSGTVSQSLGGDFKTTKVRIIGDEQEGIKLLENPEQIDEKKYLSFMKKIE